MKRRNNPNVRCAVYTRKSTDEGLDQEFNTLDAQRDAAEAFVKSQQLDGWQCMPDQYDDGGFTGGNMDRPALKRLLAGCNWRSASRFSSRWTRRGKLGKIKTGLHAMIRRSLGNFRHDHQHGGRHEYCEPRGLEREAAVSADEKRIASKEVIEFLDQLLQHHSHRNVVVVMDH